MKLPMIFAAAGMLFASLGASTTAEAQPQRSERHYESDRGHDRGDARRGDYRNDDRRSSYRNDDRRRGYRNQRNDRGNHYGWNKKRKHQQCRTEWRRGQRVRICR